MRTRTITRTITSTNITALAVNVETTATFIENYTITGVADITPEKALKLMKKACDTDTVKIVAIQTMETSEDLYGLSETDFLAYAHKLDKETRKAIEIVVD